MKGLSPYLSTDDAARALKGLMKDSDQVAVYASPDHFSDLPFHLQKRVIVVGSDRGTLRAELEEPQYADELKKWFPTAAEFVKRFNLRRERLYCLVDKENLGELRHIGLISYRTIQDEVGKILISNEA